MRERWLPASGRSPPPSSPAPSPRRSSASSPGAPATWSRRRSPPWWSRAPRPRDARRRRGGDRRLRAGGRTGPLGPLPRRRGGEDPTAAPGPALRPREAGAEPGPPPRRPRPARPRLRGGRRLRHPRDRQPLMASSRSSSPWPSASTRPRPRSTGGWPTVCGMPSASSTASSAICAPTSATSDPRPAATRPGSDQGARVRLWAAREASIRAASSRHCTTRSTMAR